MKAFNRGKSVRQHRQVTAATLNLGYDFLGDDITGLCTEVLVDPGKILDGRLREENSVAVIRRHAGIVEPVVPKHHWQG